MARYWSTPINNVPKILEAETHEETNSLIIHLTGWHVHCIHNVGLISIQIKGINKTVEIKLMATRFPTNLKIVKSTVFKNHQKLSHAKNFETENGQNIFDNFWCEISNEWDFLTNFQPLWSRVISLLPPSKSARGKKATKDGSLKMTPFVIALQQSTRSK